MNLDDLHKKYNEAPESDFVKNSRAFCMAPFVHLHITQYGTVTPCCQTPWQEGAAYGNINQSTVKEIWSGEKISAFRKKMKNDQRDERCAKCYTLENAGLMSLRKTLNRFYAHHFDKVEQMDATGHSEELKPIYLDIRFSNLCNLRCRICGPWSSTKWANDYAKLTGDASYKRTNAIQYLDTFFAEVEGLIPDIEEIYFAGGEPLMMEEHFRLLDLLFKHNNTDVIIKYSTNFSSFEFRGTHIFDYWKKFKNVFVYASLDDSGANAEFQRKDTDWQQVVSNRQKMMSECPHVNFILSPTISILNVFSISNFHREWIHLGLVKPEEIYPNALEQPEEYNIQSLPMSLKKIAADRLKTHSNWLSKNFSGNAGRLRLIENEFNNIVDFMYLKDSSNSFQKFLETTNQLDTIRNESTFAHIPELKEYVTGSLK